MGGGWEIGIIRRKEGKTCLLDDGCSKKKIKIIKEKMWGIGAKGFLLSELA